MTMQLASQGLLLIGTQAQLFKPGGLTPQGTRAPAFVDRLGALQLDPVMRSRIEASLRRFGATDDLSAVEPRALVERYLELQRARAAVGEDSGEAGGTRGRGVYEPGAIGTQTGASVARAAGPLTKAFKGEGMRLENVKATDTGATAVLVVEVPASGTTKAQTLTVPVEIEIVPTLTGAGAHGEESGMARMTLAGDAASGYRLRISLDSRLATDADVRINVGHELREGADLVRRLTHDPTVDIAAQQRAGVFEPGTSTEVTSHARAAAYELQDLLTETRAAIAAYDKARSSAAAKKGAAIPEDVRRAGEAAYRRLDAMLDAMGFADPATRAAKRSALLSTLGIDERSPLAAYVDRYADRATARVQRQAAVAALDPTARTTLTAGLGPDLEAHLMQRAPAGAVAPLAEAMGRNDAGNTIRSLVREAVRQHRAGRITDAGLVDVANRLAHLTRNYRDQVLQPATASEILKALQTEGPNVLSALGRVEAKIVPAGRLGPAGTATATTRFSPESDLTGSGTHGVNWSEADARQRSVSQQAADQAAGVTPPAHYDQGKFGSLADVWYAVQCAAQRLGPEGNAAGLPSQGVFTLPSWHTNVVYRPGQAAPMRPDVVFVLVRADGTVHAYPAVRTNVNLAAVGGVVQPVVTY
jgi:hypothetical protein